MEKFNSGKVPKYFSRADVQGNTALTCDLVAWSCQVRIHTFPLYCFPCAISCVCWLRRAHTSIVACSSSHRRAVLPAIDSLQESRNDSRRREDIYILTTWRHGEIILIAKSNSPASQDLSLPAKEGQGYAIEEREIHSMFIGRRVSGDDNFGIYIISER